ncbi:cyclin-dependent kinase-like 2 [Ptychodera flava]|uniref:cyclin-dependent kinase-like 2 n=1 Tax=Ptychodera flava TaxID=63121 RepID=UPI00396A37AD
MAFKLPKLPARAVSTPTLCAELKGVPIFNYKDVSDKVEIGRGTFSTVSVATYKSGAGAARVVVKDLHNLDQDGKRLLQKEATLLNNMDHENIVQFKGISMQPHALMMEYVYFDFKPFKRDMKVHSLREFLSETSSDSIDYFKHLIPVIATQVTSGLAYRHDNSVVHRDPKPENVLVSNQHYCSVTDIDELGSKWSASPIVCKLTGFGESRSAIIQTQSLAMTGTRNMNRGTPAFTAPEISLPECDTGQNVTLEELKKVDIWALGLLFYNLMNPNLSFPYLYELKNDNIIPRNFKNYVHNMMRNRRLLSSVPEYMPLQATAWRLVYDAFELCSKCEPGQRPTAVDVMDTLHPVTFKVVCLNKHFKYQSSFCN